MPGTWVFVIRSIILRLQDMLVATWPVAYGRHYGTQWVMTAAEDHGIRAICLRNRLKSVSSSVLEWSGGEVCRHTVVCRLRQGGIKCRSPCKFTRLKTIGKTMGSTKLDRLVRNRPDPPRNPVAMPQTLNAAWTAIDQPPTRGWRSQWGEAAVPLWKHTEAAAVPDAFVYC